MTDPRALLREMFDAAVAAAQPEVVIPDYLPQAPTGKTIIIGAGKASAQMGKAFEEAWIAQGHAAPCGVIVTQYGAGVPMAHIEMREAAHPVPDEAGYKAAQELLDLARSAQEGDLVVALISGGGSSLLPLPAEGLTLDDEQEINRALLASGAPISKMNVVRKAFSQIKGGRLAAACHPAKLVTLVLSDVPGDDPAMVASGPTIADENGLEEASEIISAYNIALPQAARELLDAGKLTPPPTPDAAELKNAEHHVIASAGMSLEAAEKVAKAAGFGVSILGDDIEGEASVIGREHADLFLKQSAEGTISKPHVMLSGGETTVTLGDTKDGKGGRCTEYLLGQTLAFAGRDDVYLIAADTDGRDGSEHNAGAFADAGTIARIADAGEDAQALLEGHKAFTAFELAGDLLNTGPTGTNVNDFRAILWV